MNMNPDDQELPQTTQVFDAPQMDANGHDWRQEGYAIYDNCSPKTPVCYIGAIPIKNGTMLIKNKEGKYDFINESS